MAAEVRRVLQALPAAFGQLAEPVQREAAQRKGEAAFGALETKDAGAREIFMIDPTFYVEWATKVGAPASANNSAMEALPADGDAAADDAGEGAVSPEVDALLRSLGVPPGDADDAAPLAAPIPNCYAVGDARLLAGEYPGDRVAAAAREKLERLLDAGVTFFLDLTAEGELRTCLFSIHETDLREPMREGGVDLPMINTECGIGYSRHSTG